MQTQIVFVFWARSFVTFQNVPGLKKNKTKWFEVMLPGQSEVEQLCESDLCDDCTHTHTDAQTLSILYIGAFYAPKKAPQMKQ